MTEMMHCQSCGMPLVTDKEYFGKNKDGSINEDYCEHCFPNGEFNNPDETVEEMIESCIPFLENMSREDARDMLKEFLPTLKRWRK